MKKQSMTSQIKYLKKRIVELEEKCRLVEEDREKFRTYFAMKLKWFIELHGANKTPNMAWLIEDTASASTFPHDLRLKIREPKKFNDKMPLTEEELEKLSKLSGKEKKKYIKELKTKYKKG